MTSDAARPSQVLAPTEPAVLLLIFNRADLTARTLAAIREAKPRRLYIAADGPRPGHATDGANCREARELIQTIDWPCEVFTLLRQHNLGCSSAITDGIDWFFLNEQEGIILEDDCLPSPAFFSWCQYGLDRFRDDHRVIMVCGTPFHEHCSDDEPIRLSKYTSVWGWATWRDRWTHHRRDADHLSLRAVHSRCFGPAEVEYWQNRYHLAYRGSWDYRLCLYALGNGFLSAMPPYRLIANQATVDGALTLQPKSLEAKANDWPPLPIREDTAYDVQAFSTVFKAPHMWRPLSRWGRLYVRLRTWAALSESQFVLKRFDRAWATILSLKQVFSGRDSTESKS